jgi:hypothetical protein
MARYLLRGQRLPTPTNLQLITEILAEGSSEH